MKSLEKLSGNTANSTVLSIFETLYKLLDQVVVYLFKPFEAFVLFFRYGDHLRCHNYFMNLFIYKLCAPFLYVFSCGKQKAFKEDTSLDA